MGRTITSAAQTAAESEIVRPVRLVELDFSGGFMRLTTANQDIPFDSNGDLADETFTGVGRLASISRVEEGAEQKAYSINIRISGVATQHISTILTNTYQNRSAKVWLGLLDVNLQLVADPVLTFSGRMDTLDLTLGKTAEISIIVQSRLADWERARLLRYTNEEQQRLFLGDKGLEFVPQMVEKTIIWGR